MKLATRTKRFLALLLAFAMMTMSLAYADTAEEGGGEAPAEEKRIEFTRVSGDSRYDTAIATAETLKEVLEVESFENIIVASGTSFPDALAGSYLSAAKGNAPILLVANSNKIIDQVSEYVIDNIAEDGTVYLLGGTAAVPADFREVLTDAGIKSKRLKGGDRFATNLAILEEAGVEDEESLIVATGSNFADSLSASASGAPLLLVGRALSDAQKAFLEDAEFENIYIVGGEGAVLPAVETELGQYAENVERLAGANRFETSTAIAAKFDHPESLVLAYAQNFPDGLSAGPLAQAIGAPLVLTQNAQVAIDTAIAWRATQNIRGGFVLGGPTLISDETADTIFNTAEFDRTTYYVLAGKEVGWNVTVGFTDESEDDSLVVVKPGKKVGKHEVAVENSQWITLADENALDENNNFTFEIPTLGMDKANISYLITAWTNDDVSYADPDGTSQDLSQVEVQDYDEDGQPEGDPYKVPATEPYILKVGDVEYTPNTNAFGENAIDASGVGSYSADIHFSKEFWNDWCAVVIVVEETVSGVAPEPTPVPEDNTVHEIHGGTLFLKGANEDWSDIQSNGYAYNFGETTKVYLRDVDINNPYYLVPAIVFDNEIDDPNILEDMFDVEVKVYADGNEVEVTVPEGGSKIWMEDTEYYGVPQEGNCARLYGGINTWGTSFIDPTALNGAEEVYYEITINKIDGKAYLLGADAEWAAVQSDPVEFKIGEPFEITVEGPIVDPFWLAPSLIFNQEFANPDALDDIYDVDVQLFVDGIPCALDVPEGSALIWAEGNTVVVPGEEEPVEFDGNSARLYGGYNEWGTAYVPKNTFNNAEEITYRITINKKADGVAFILGADGEWNAIQSEPVPFKVDGNKYEVSITGPVVDTMWIAPSLIFYNDFDDPSALNDKIDVSVNLVVDGISQTFDWPEEGTACIWAEANEIVVPGEFDEEGQPVKIKYDGNSARLYGGYNEWGTQFIAKDALNEATSIRYIFTLQWDVTSGLKYKAEEEEEEADPIFWTGNVDFDWWVSADEPGGYSNVSVTDSNGLTLTVSETDAYLMYLTVSEEAAAVIEKMTNPTVVFERPANGTVWGFGIHDTAWNYLAGASEGTETADTVLMTAYDPEVTYCFQLRQDSNPEFTISIVDLAVA